MAKEDWKKELGLTGRTTKRLEQNGVDALREFMALDEETVMGWNQTGATVWKEISDKQANINKDQAPTSTPAEDFSDHPLLGGGGGGGRKKPKSEPDEDEKPARRRRRGERKDGEKGEAAAPTGDGDSVVGLINWAIDAAAYDKTMCRDLLVKARKMLAGK